MAPDTAVLTDAAAEEESGGLFTTLFNQLPQRLRESFSAEQKAALREAAVRCTWGKHPTDVRLTIPLFSKRYYVVLLAGEERRSRERIRAERRQRPLATGGNIALLVGLVTAGTIFGSLIWTLLFIWFLSF